MGHRFTHTGRVREYVGLHGLFGLGRLRGFGLRMMATPTRRRAAGRREGASGALRLIALKR
jgi:hypothetical protein